MIPYDRHKWFLHIFGWQRSVLPIVLPRMLALTGWGGLVAYLHTRGYAPSVPPMLHGVLGTVLGLILAFRTNTAYDRFWEGRRSWGTVTNRSRDLMRQLKTYLDAPEVEQRAAKLILGFVHGLKRHLWHESSTPELARLLGQTEAHALESAPGAAQQCMLRLSTLCLAEQRKGHLTELQFQLLDRNMTELIDQMGVCQRIQRTPIPYAYVVYLRRFMLSYLITLPLALDSEMTWGVPGFMFIVSYAMFGLEEIGVQVEDPFDRSPHDLDLERITKNIERDVLALAGAAEALPESALLANTSLATARIGS